MKILVVSNLYPPFFVGGCELHCQEVVEALRSRGHQVSVLTSTYGMPGRKIEGEVYRLLSTRMNYSKSLREAKLLLFLRVLSDNLTDNRTFCKLLQDVQPDVIQMWNPYAISRSLVSMAEDTGVPVAYMVRGYYNLPIQVAKDPWFSFWNQDPAPPAWRGLRQAMDKLQMKRLLARYAPTEPRRIPGRRVIYNSHYTLQKYREHGVDTEGSEVIYGGIRMDRLLQHAVSSSSDGVAILYAGRIGRTKGVHTLVEAFAKLVNERGYQNARLTLVGGSVDQEYEAEIKRMVVEHNLEHLVTFTGQIPKDEMLKLYSRFDIFVFPSSAEEPYGWTLREAMAAGLPVVGTLAGGAAEILKDGETCLSFAVGDAPSLASQMERLIGDAALRVRLVENGREAVRIQCSFESEIDRIERHLKSVANMRREKAVARPVESSLLSP